MAEPIELVKGRWWRFNRYEIRDRYIRPAPGAALEEFDPWAEFLKVRTKTRSGQGEGPVELLARALHGVKFDLLHTPGPFTLTPESEKQILAWCSKFGLLGLLPHVCLAVNLPPRFFATPGPHGGPRIYQEQYVRTAGDWRAVCHQYELRDYKVAPENYAVPETPWEGKPFLGPAYPQDFAAPQALVWQLGINPTAPQWEFFFDASAQLGWEPLSKTWCRFFPDVAEAERSSFDYPAPFDGQFWRAYAEPLEAFLYGASRIVRSAFYLSGYLKAPPKHPDTATLFLQDTPLPGLLQAVGNSAEFDPKGKLVSRLVSPSLAGLLGYIVVKDIQAGSKVLQCGECGTPFITRSYQGRFCASRCRLRWEKREQRKREAQGARPTRKKSGKGRRKQP